jgi:thiamine-phosphate diphosphorylase
VNALPRPCVYAVSGRRRLVPGARTWADERRGLQDWVEELIAAGADVIQLRERDVPARALAELVRDCVRATAGTSTRVVVSDRVDIALAAGAAGVHLPADGLPSVAVRALWPDGLVGRSIHGRDGCAAAAPCDYVIYGTVFQSRSKPDVATDDDCAGLAQAVNACACPVLAIGGVTPSRVGAIAATGAAGVAAIGVFLPEGLEPEALGPTGAVRAIREAWRREMVQ